jgi:hypothetical protein
MVMDERSLFFNALQVIRHHSQDFTSELQVHNAAASRWLKAIFTDDRLANLKLFPGIQFVTCGASDPPKGAADRWSPEWGEGACRCSATGKRSDAFGLGDYASTYQHLLLAFSLRLEVGRRSDCKWLKPLLIDRGRQRQQPACLRAISYLYRIGIQGVSDAPYENIYASA